MLFVNIERIPGTAGILLYNSDFVQDTSTASWIAECMGNIFNEDPHGR
jgi:hypothetical protein